ncbi:MAG TPA: winged helix-turn-helix domain-containing protein [Candidatus Acidoferrales bacterium]|jgi:DNA-binding winged helix-turn-helix (wHTH) protein/Flp pilus assembly protein TadD|nr:winged helix-turn-helix domain-containing protein [Candidatus Acidoferrales bacterium]
MSVYEFGPFRLDADQLLLFEGGEPVALGPKVVETLLALIEHPGDVLTKSALLDRIWPEGYVDEANLAQNVYVLRKVLRGRWEVEAIETIPRRGYRFVAPVAKVEAVQVPRALPAVSPVAARPRRLWESFAVAALALVLVGGTAFALASPRHVSRAPLTVAGARLYEIGRYYWNTRSHDGLIKSLDYFSRVVDSDPHDARGYAALASANAIMGDYQYGTSPQSVYYARARAYAQKALAIDPQSGEAYAVLGMLESVKEAQSKKSLAEGIRQLRHAIELDPSDAPAHEWYGIALLAAGNVNEAYAELQKASNLDPLSVATTHWLGQTAYLERHYDDAISYERQVLDLSPQLYEAFETLGLAYEARGDYRQAIDAFRQFGERCKMCRSEAAALLANVYARTNPSLARAEFAIAKAHAADVDPSDLALAYAAMGERTVALSYFKHIHGDYMQAATAMDPRFDALRDDPQFTHIAQKPA